MKEKDLAHRCDDGKSSTRPSGKKRKRERGRSKMRGSSGRAVSHKGQGLSSVETQRERELCKTRCGDDGSQRGAGVGKRK